MELLHQDRYHHHDPHRWHHHPHHHNPCHQVGMELDSEQEELWNSYTEIITTIVILVIILLTIVTMCTPQKVGMELDSEQEELWNSYTEENREKSFWLFLNTFVEKWEKQVTMMMMMMIMTMMMILKSYPPSYISAGALD